MEAGLAGIELDDTAQLVLAQSSGLEAAREALESIQKTNATEGPKSAYEMAEVLKGFQNRIDEIGRDTGFSPLTDASSKDYKEIAEKELAFRHDAISAGYSPPTEQQSEIARIIEGAVSESDINLDEQQELQQSPIYLPGPM